MAFSCSRPHLKLLGSWEHAYFVLRLLERTEPIGPQTPDALLVRRAQAGEALAFRALFERHVASVRRFLLDLLREREAASDATQETFSRAHALLGRLQERDRFKGWLLGIARNVAFEAHRAHHLEDLAEDEGGTPDAVIPSPNPETVLLDRELEVHFREALAALSPKRRAALLLRLDHGLSYEDIAAALEWSIPSVKNEIHRARLALRVALLPHLGEGARR